MLLCSRAEDVAAEVATTSTAEEELRPRPPLPPRPRPPRPIVTDEEVVAF
jgi:hypothetical protein